MEAASGLTCAVVDAGAAEARWALGQYVAELDRRFAGGFDSSGALDSAAASFDPPAGLFVVARLGGDVVGCAGLQWLDRDTAEVKRMWVDPRRRGAGVGRRLLAHLEGEARATGRSRVVLDTNEALTEAVAMYQALGYVAIERYNDNPYAHHWFEKVLAPG